MAAISSAFHVQSLCSTCLTTSHVIPNQVSYTPPCSPIHPIRMPYHQNHGLPCSFKHLGVKNPSRLRPIGSVAEETLAPEAQNSEEEVSSSTDQTVSVPVSPSDKLIMFFQADGMMNEAAIPTVTKALEVVEGVANLKVQLVEGIASVELTKETTVQATGVASSLVESIQGLGFKLQTLNLSFEDEEDTIC